MNAVVNTDAGDGLGPLAQVGLLSPGVVLTVALAGLFLVLVAGILGLLAVRRVRRSRFWSSGVLALRSETGTGTGSELAALRLQLNRAIDATAAALAAARTSDTLTVEFSATAATLTQTAQAVDRQLRTARRDPDPATKAAALAALRPQVQQLLHAASTIRQGLARANEATTARELERLQTRGPARSDHPQDARPETPQDAV